MIKFSTTFLATLITASVNVATVDLCITETTDLHSNMMDFDYYKDTATEKLGLVRTASPVNDARSETKNNVLVDNSGLIQGSPLVDYMPTKGLKASDIHPIYKALNTLDYTVGTPGNHELNYGLDYLRNALAGAKLPYVNANVIGARTKQSMFTPYLIEDIEVVDKDRKKQTLKTGYTDVVPPQITGWDKTNLFGEVTVNGIAGAACKYVPEMREKGADVVVALAHSGLLADPYKAMTENSVYYLSEIPGVNVIMFGHVHAVFPGRDLADIEGINIAKGTSNDVSAIVPDIWDDHFNVVDLQLSNDSGKWQVTQAKTEARPIYNIASRKFPAAEDSKLVEALRANHDATRQLVSKPVGKSVGNMRNYLAFVQDDPTVQVVNNVRKAYVEHYIQDDPDLAKLLVFSAAAPFRVGGCKNDLANYVEVEKGQLTFHNAADLYLYPNTLIVVKASGKEVKEWLECPVEQFNQINLNSTKPQSLVNRDGFRTYNFNVIGGTDCQIDVTQLVRYDGEYQTINANTERIRSLTSDDKPVDPNAVFLVATSNYRAYGDKSVGTGDNHTAFASPNENRSVLAAWITNKSKRTGEIHPVADSNWRLTLIAGDKELGIRSEAFPSDKAAAFVKEKGQYPINRVATSDTGFVIYQVGLSK